MPFEKDVLTTGEVAEICKVAPRTVSKWFDSGELEGYRIPGSKDRRIPTASLIRFMKRHRIPLDGLQAGGTRVLVVDADVEVARGLASIIADQTDYEASEATTSFQAGMLCEKLRPHVVLLDLHLEDGQARAVVDMIRQSDHLALCRIIAMSGKLTDGQAQGLHAQGYDGFLKKPFPARDALRAIEAALALV